MSRDIKKTGPVIRPAAGRLVNAMNRFETPQRQSSIKQNLQLRARMVQAIRTFFIAHDYLEVETPHRIPAPAPEAHIDAPASGDWFLHTSPELCMKRLLAAGYDRLFQICRCFREKERGGKHLPEMTLLEWYTAGGDYRDMMDQCEALLQFVARRVGAGKTITYQGKSVDLTAPWPRLTVTRAFDQYGAVSMKQAIAIGRFDEIMGCDIEPKLGRRKPVFLHDYPSSRSALAKLKPENPPVAERFELYIAGLELCNAFTELIDPCEQRERFADEIRARRDSGKMTYPMPEKFLKSLESMPEATGNALGVDRLAMLFADAARIDDIVAFTPEEL